MRFRANLLEKQAMEEVAEDLLCIGCGYNLRHARVEGKCPECGVEVVKSIDGDQLYRADANWLVKVRRGMGLIIASVLTIWVSLIVVLVFRPPALRQWMTLGVFASLMSLGVWWTTTAEKERWRVGLLARVAIPIFLLGIVIDNTAIAVSVNGRLSNWYWLAHTLALVSVIAMCLMLFAVFRRSGEIARRSFSPGLRWQANMFAVGAVTMAGILATGEGIPFAKIVVFLGLVVRVCFVLTITWGVVVLGLVRGRITGAMKMGDLK